MNLERQYALLHKLCVCDKDGEDYVWKNVERKNRCLCPSVQLKSSPARSVLTNTGSTNTHTHRSVSSASYTPEENFRREFWESVFFKLNSRMKRSSGEEPAEHDITPTTTLNLSDLHSPSLWLLSTLTRLPPSPGETPDSHYSLNARARHTHKHTLCINNVETGVERWR